MLPNCALLIDPRKIIKIFCIISVSGNNEDYLECCCVYLYLISIGAYPILIGKCFILIGAHLILIGVYLTSISECLILIGKPYIYKSAEVIQEKLEFLSDALYFHGETESISKIMNLDISKNILISLTELETSNEKKLTIL